MSCRLLLLVSRGPAPRRRLLPARPRPCVRHVGLQESYRLLQLPDDGGCSPAQVRDAYLRLAKAYHPDSGAPTADPALFAHVQEAYRTVLAHQSRAGRPEGGAEEEGGGSAGTAPQHRRYLSYQGVGPGTPGQRERQYRQVRVDRASQQVLEYRQRQQERAAGGGALAERDLRRRSREVKITQAVERLVEDLIQESMARGDFQNLSGAGKPLSKFRADPHADPMTHNLNRILLDNGYRPPWVAARRRIREGHARARARLLEGRARLGRDMTPGEQRRWAELCAAVREELLELNKMVDDYNLIAPALSMQMVHFSPAREVERAERHRAERRREGEEERRAEEEKETEKSRSSRAGLLSWMQGWFRP